MTKDQFIQIYNSLENAERIMKVAYYDDGIVVILNLKHQLIEQYYSNNDNN
ncbi:hypothetical protein AWH56_010720 [Anaerobacillus isosaccharinicus]|uniref:Uncharacterized protein n=1 Tax=Anaerobacillus isosaccharinicus TaxID=1532552 RepID=A0A7S7LBH5_9BACI|nr:hypothetical protein [Anaerobacillus isosaccharinicus]MBA5588598.1 hypothetical protein [Anaerobacillus isosaccharinicus]QOY37989.1 hypothetical protein AWH56_010720 [Anaerobacillus isosaccharinicus]